MSHTVKLVNSETTIDFTVANGYYLTDYVPSNGNGTVTETLQMMISGTSQSDVESKIQSIEKVIRLTEQYQSNLQGLQLWLQFQPDGLSNLLRSPVVAGRVVLDKSTLDYGWGLKKVRISVILEREAWWETTTDIEVPLTNANGTNVIGGINIANCNDLSGSVPNKRCNYVQIAGADVGGNMPARFRLEITNTYDSSERLANIWVGHNLFSAPASFNHIIEGESAIFGGTNVSGSYSGGYAINFAIPSGSLSLLGIWQLSSALLANAGGRWFKIMAILSSDATSEIYVQSRVTFPSGSPLTVLMQDQEIGLRAGVKYQEIGTLQLPPWLVEASSIETLDLSLYGRKNGGGNLYIDYLILMPADQMRQFRPSGYNIQYTWKLVDDGINKQLYVLTDENKKASYIMELGDKLYLEPGRTQRLYFLMSGDTGGVAINRTATVRMYYRQRYATI